MSTIEKKAQLMIFIRLLNVEAVQSKNEAYKERLQCKLKSRAKMRLDQRAHKETITVKNLSHIRWDLK